MNILRNRLAVKAFLVAAALMSGIAVLPGWAQASGSGTVSAAPWQNELTYPGSLALPERGHAWPGPETFTIGNAIAPLNYWMTAWTVNDVMKMTGFEAEIGDTRRSVMWTPIIEGMWARDRRYEIPTDEFGWPTSMVLSGGQRADRYSTIVMGDSSRPPAFPEGEYRLLYEGEGEFAFDGASIVSEAQGEIILQYDGHQTLFVHMTDTNPDNHLRNIRLLRPDAVEGERFPRTYIDYLRPYSVIRPLHFIGEQLTYGPYARWEERKTPDYSHWGGAFGAPYEVAIELANQSASDLWLNLPIAADDDYLRNLAQLTLDLLDPERKLYLEYGNELWNWSYPYQIGRDHVLAWAQERWPDVLGEVRPYTDGDPVSETMMIYSWQGARTTEISDIFDEVWGDQADRLVVVLAGQVGASQPFWDPSRYLLECPVGVGEEGLEPPAANADAFAIAPYFSEEEGVIEFDRSSPAAFFDDALDFVRGEGQWGEDAAEPGLRYQIRSDKRLADEYELPLIAYEGGQHFIGSTYTRDVISNHPLMRTLYDAYFEVWQEEGGGLFVHFAGIIPRGQNEPGTEPNYFQTENFGIKERQTQTREEAPKWDEVLTTMEEIGQLEPPTPTPAQPTPTPTVPPTPTPTPQPTATPIPQPTATPTPTPTPTPGAILPIPTPINENSLVVVDDSNSSQDLTGATDFDPVNDRNISLAWNANNIEATDWHVYVREGLGGVRFLGRTADGEINNFNWNDSADNPIDTAFANGPDFNSVYTFRVIRIDDSLGPDDFFDLKGAIGYNLEGGNPVSISLPENPQIEVGKVVIYDDILGGDNLVPKDGTGSDVDSEASRAIQLAWNFGVDPSTVNEYHVFVSVNGNDFEFLGQTQSSATNYFWWTPNNEFRTASAYRNGPEGDNSYQFQIVLVPITGNVQTLTTGVLDYSVN